MRSVTRRVILASLVALLGAPGFPRGAAAEDMAAVLEHPLARSKLSLVDGSKPERRRVGFKARFERRGTMENPSFAGSTLRVRGSTPTAGDSGLINLLASKWHALGTPPGSGGYRYEDPTGSARGIRLLMLKQGRRRGVLKVAGGSASWPYVVSGPQGVVTVTLTVGEARWCAEFRRVSSNGAHRVSAKSNAAPASCPCEQFNSTFASIQSVVFERHGCTTGPCHGASAQGGLDLRPEVAYRNLVDVPSSIAPDQKRVEPGLALESMLWRKLAKATTGLADVPGTGMPNGFPPIPDNELEAMRLWIHAGAPETGVVPDTEPLLGSCLPPADPIKIRAPAPPAPDAGIQLHAPEWSIAPHGESEICYATYYNFASTIPDAAKAPCPAFWGGPSRTCFFYNKSALTQEPNSHHSIIHLYKGAYDSTRPGFQLFTCQGGEHDGALCNIPSRPDCVFADGKAGGSCVETPYDIRTADSGFGPFTCRGGANDGQTCDPLNLGVPAPAGADCGPGGGCAGKVKSGVACILYGPPDFGFSLAGAGSNNAPSIGGSQQPVSSNAYPPEVFSMLPVDGIVVWNSHAFNVTDQPTTNQQWLNIYFAGAGDRTYPVQGIFDATDIFIQDVKPFEKTEYCRTYTLPRGARLFQLSSHTHKRGKLFRIWGPGISERCGSETPVKPVDCKPEAGPPIFTTTNYSDPMVLTFDPPVVLAGDDDSRTYKFCSVYNNGADVPTDVKRQSTSPKPPVFFAPGGPCKDNVAACLAGPHKGELCNGDDRACDSAPGANDGACDACPLVGGVTTEDEMFILLGLYYVVP
jgi:hypothetical protein